MDRGTLFGVNIDAVSVGFDTSSVVYIRKKAFQGKLTADYNG
jgi:hypothetical protein